jgi:tetratricopeptide (TPR) repeat protein
LTFGGVAIDTPQIFFYGQNIDPTQPPSGASAGPEMIIGMDVLRKLHLYFAFNENKLYISQASQPEPANIAPFSPEYLAFQLSAFDKLLLANPENADGLQTRCFWRAVAKTDLDAAIADCNQSLALKPNAAASYYSRALVLYQQAKYQEALGDDNSALAANPNISDALFLRGMIKGQLGDQIGKGDDIAAAKALMPRVEMNFRRLGISD